MNTSRDLNLRNDWAARWASSNGSATASAGYIESLRHHSMHLPSAKELPLLSSVQEEVVDRTWDHPMQLADLARSLLSFRRVPSLVRSVAAKLLFWRAVGSLGQWLRGGDSRTPKMSDRIVLCSFRRQFLLQASSPSTLVGSPLVISTSNSSRLHLIYHFETQDMREDDQAS